MFNNLFYKWVWASENLRGAHKRPTIHKFKGTYCIFQTIRSTFPPKFGRKMGVYLIVRMWLTWLAGRSLMEWGHRRQEQGHCFRKPAVAGIGQCCRP